MIFPCEQCGLCCKHVNLITELQEYDLGNGRCRNLLDNNLCAIYANRPIICNVDRMYDLYFANVISRQAYYKLNIEGCIKLKNEFEY